MSLFDDFLESTQPTSDARLTAVEDDTKVNSVSPLPPKLNKVRIWQELNLCLSNDCTIL